MLYRTNTIFLLITMMLIGDYLMVDGCLITNCPRGGKRNGKINFLEGNVKPCLSCGPGRSGQCFGPNICCGPFGCLMGTPETIRCQQNGLFHDREPCIAGNSSCRRNSGRCASEGICCNQDACYSDKQCTTSPEEKPKILSGENLLPIDLYSFVNYPSEILADK